MNDMYLILHESTLDGKAMWWKPNPAGYTVRLNEAGRYTKDEAMSIARIHGTDFPVPESDIDSVLKVRHIAHVDDGDNYKVLKAYAS